MGRTPKGSPMQTEQSAKIIRFAGFELDTMSGELRRKREPGPILQ